jgi:transposase InsO family protein
MAALSAAEESVSELCEDFGISRKTAYKWWRRYLEFGAEGLKEHSHAPQVVPWAISQAQAEAIVGLRRAHPSWGPRKLRAKLSQCAPGQSWPAPSTIGELLRRQQLTEPRKRRKSARPSPLPLRTALGPNELWCTDFKGPFRTGDGVRCDPFTLTDAYSRYLLSVKAVDKAGYADCRSELERVFREYGLPRAIRSDNGPPFASVGVTGLSRLAVWWLKLGIMPERIEPGRPEQNGRHERMHKTLKAECAAPPEANRGAQQRRFDQFRQEFNHQRPHEALGQTAPAVHYTPSERGYPARLEDPEYPANYQPRRVRRTGEIKWQGEFVFLTRNSELKVPHPPRAKARRPPPTNVGGNSIQDWGIGFGVDSGAALALAASAAAFASAFSLAAFWRNCCSIARSLPGFTGFLNSAPSRPRRRERFRM